MNRDEHDSRVKALIEKYQNWFDSERRGWGMYELYSSPGWFGIIKKLLADIMTILPPDKQSCFNLAQIKSKFGELRVYYKYQDTRHGRSSTDRSVPHNAHIREEINVLISEASSKSVKTCVYCGDHGELRCEGWWVTVCDYHYALKNEGKNMEDDYELMTTPARRH